MLVRRRRPSLCRLYLREVQAGGEVGGGLHPLCETAGWKSQGPAILDIEGRLAAEEVDTKD